MKTLATGGLTVLLGVAHCPPPRIVVPFNKELTCKDTLLLL